jgi:outer membrane protein assembly factor BamB
MMLLGSIPVSNVARTTASPTVLFTDDFSNPTWTATNWNKLAGTWSVTNGQYVGAASYGNRHISLAGPAGSLMSVTDFSLSVKVTNTLYGTYNQGACVPFKYYDYGHMGIVVFFPDKIGLLFEIGYSYPCYGVIYKTASIGYTQHALKITASGNNYQVFLDDMTNPLIKTTFDPTGIGDGLGLPGKNVGVWAYEYGSAMFDDFTVTDNAPVTPTSDGWTMFRHDVRHMGQSEYDTSSNGGQKYWEFTTAGFVYSSPAIAPDGTIYVGSGDGKLYAINPDGTKKWSFATGTGIQSSPAIASDGTIVFGSFNNKVYALNSNGVKKWEYTTGGSIHSSPMIGEDGTIYVGSYDGKLYAITPSGSLKWSFTTGGEVKSTPAIGSDGTIYVGSYDRKLYAIDPNGVKKWDFTTGDSVASSPSIGSDGTIYFGSWDRKAYALTSSGAKKWEFTTGSYIYSSPAIATDGTIYIGSYDGKLYALNPTGSKKWEFNLGKAVHCSPAIGAEGTVYVANSLVGAQCQLYAIQSNGVKKWEFAASNYLSSCPAIGKDGTIYVGSGNYKLYALKSAVNAPPTCTIIAPASDPYYTESPTVTLSGIASDDKAVTSVTWSNAATGGLGTASGTTSWTITGIALTKGDNLISVIAHDAAGSSSAVDTITVNYHPVIACALDIDPNTLNLKSNGKWITAYIELPIGLDPADIVISSLSLNGVIAPSGPSNISDYDSDGVSELMVKFDRASVAGLLSVGTATLTITGELTDDTEIKGSCNITVIDPTTGNKDNGSTNEGASSNGKATQIDVQTYASPASVGLIAFIALISLFGAALLWRRSRDR